MRAARARRPEARGGALVETALGLLVFVTILVFGIHFAELGYLTPKVSEVAASALWDTTAKLMHHHPNNYSRRQQAMRDAAPDALARYSGFDGRTGVSSRMPSLVFTEAKNLTAGCAPDDLGVDLVGPAPAVYGGGNGGLGCWASADMGLVNFPRSFLDDGDRPFRVKHYNYTGTGIPVCSMGRHSAGCAGQMTILLDDWGLTTAYSESNPYTLGGGGGNDPFHDLVQPVYASYLGGGSGTGAAMAVAVTGADPSMGELKFWFSYFNSRDPDFPGVRDSGDPGDNQTNVRSGSKNSAYSDHGSCFLGGSCP